MAAYSLPTPSFDQEPFFSWVYHTPIVAGSFSVFKTSQGKLQVARILEVSKALLKGYEVKANLFIPFDEWEITTRYPVSNGLGKNRQEIVATQDVVTYHFDPVRSTTLPLFSKSNNYWSMARCCKVSTMSTFFDTSATIQRFSYSIPSHLLLGTLMGCLFLRYLPAFRREFSATSKGSELVYILT
jgi:hypothetical protein